MNSPSLPAILGICLLTLGLTLPATASVAANDRVRVSFYPSQGERQNPVVADYIGHLYQPPKALRAVTAGSQVSPEEHQLRRMMDTIGSGTLDEFIALWENPDQDEVRRYYKNQPGLWDKLQQHYNQMPDQRLANVMYYGSYRLLQVLKFPPKLAPYVSTVVFKNTSDGLRLTNDLEGDAVHAYFATEFATRLVEEFMRSKKAGKR